MVSRLFYNHISKPAGEATQRRNHLGTIQPVSPEGACMDQPIGRSKAFVGRALFTGETQSRPAPLLPCDRWDPWKESPSPLSE